MSLRVLLVSDRTEIEETLREDPGASAYWMERRPPALVVPAEVAREFAIVLVDFGSATDGLGLSRALRAANKTLEVIAIAGPEAERMAVESLKGGVFDYVIWPAAEASALWEVLANCARKVQPAEMEFPIAYGRYTLLERLGVGGMAEVFLAETGTPPKRVVVKRMLQSLAAGDEFVAMFMDEARISSMLVHPNIVRVNDFGRVDDSLYIAMEYVAGRNLEQLRLALAAPFPPAIACYIVAEICAGLGHAHTKVDASGMPLGIVHRDVNPPNVMIADDGRVMLTDFGIAKAAHRYYETTSGTLKGKFEYMSPEQANGKVVDRRADVFCAGLVLYELLCGTRPFMAPTPIETLFLIQECKPEPPSRWNARLPKALDEICMKALAKDPAARYQEAAELERDLREFARTTMNPGPRDLAVFAKNVGKQQRVEEEAPAARVVPAKPPTAPADPPESTQSDGAVTALLQRMRRKTEPPSAAPKLDDGPTLGGSPPPPLAAAARPVPASPAAGPPRPAQVPSGLSSLVAAVLDETPPRGTAVPRPPVAAKAAPDPAAPAPATPKRPLPPPAVETRRADPPRTPGAPASVPVPAEIPEGAGTGDITMPGVLADLEREASGALLPHGTRILPSANGGASAPAPPPPREPEPTPIEPRNEDGTRLGAPAPEPVRSAGTASSELFPAAAKEDDRARVRTRMRLQLGVGIGAGLLLAVVGVAAGTGAGLFGSPSPTPYLAVLSPTPTPPRPDTAEPSPAATAGTPRPTATPARTALAATPATPAPAVTATAAPSRTVAVAATPRPSPAKTAAPVAKGMLSVWVDGWATVEIDGKPSGNAPFVGLSLPAGKHRVVLHNAAKVRREFEVVIEPGKEKKLAVDFR